MERTTLVTFLLQHPTAKKVELLGSWDNFSKPYGMQRDRRRGGGVWSGCHTFHDIICDGDDQGIHEKRAGGLKMGGTYWYFYRLDDDEEYFDPSQETTTACPLMPGQTLNVLDVPSDIEGCSGHSRSASMISLLNIVKTLNPDDRYVNPRPMPSKEKAEAIASPRHIPLPPSADSERPSSRKRRWSSYLAGQCAQQGHTRSSAYRAVQSAPASPIAARAGYIEAAVPYWPTTFSSQHTFYDIESVSNADDWVIRGDRLSIERDGCTGASSVLSYCALEDVLEDVELLPETAFGDQWPLVPLSRGSVPQSEMERSYDNTLFIKHPQWTEMDISHDMIDYNKARASSINTLPPKDTADSLHYQSWYNSGNDEYETSPFMSGALSLPMAADMEPLTLPVSLLPEPSFLETNKNEMHKALQALDEQYTLDQHSSPWYSTLNLPHSSAVESISDAASPIFSAVHGSHASDTCTSHRHSELWPLQPSPFNDFNFDFQLDEPKPQIYSSHYDTEESKDVNASFEHLSIHTTETVSTTSTAIPAAVSWTDEEALRELRHMLRQLQPPLYQGEVTTGEDGLLDEFEYLGAALI